MMEKLPASMVPSLSASRQIIEFDANAIIASEAVTATCIDGFLFLSNSDKYVYRKNISLALDIFAERFFRFGCNINKYFLRCQHERYYPMDVYFVFLIKA